MLSILLMVSLLCAGAVVIGLILTRHADAMAPRPQRVPVRVPVATRHPRRRR